MKRRNFTKSPKEIKEDQKFFDEIRNIDDEKCYFPKGYNDL